MKKVFVSTLMAICALSVFANGSQESSKAVYPATAIELVALGSPGGGSDVLARNITDVINSYNLVPQPVNVVDKAGGGGAVGMAYFNAKKDVDYNLMTINSTHCLLIHTTDVVAKGSWTPIACVATDEQTIVVRSESPFKTWGDVEKAIKANPGSLTVGGCDDMDAMTLNILERSTGTKFNHTAYFASSEIFNALLGGHIDFCIANPAEVVGLLEGGRVRVLGTFSPKRLTGIFSDVPCFVEMGYKDCHVQMIRGIVGPYGMNREARNYWVDILKKVCDTAEWKKNYLEKNYLGDNYIGGDDFDKFLVEHEKILVDFAKQNGIKIIK